MQVTEFLTLLQRLLETVSLLLPIIAKSDPYLHMHPIRWNGSAFGLLIMIIRCDAPHGTCWLVAHRLKNSRVF